MLKLLVKALVLLVGLAVSGAACAVGMGGINVTSALGEPLKAEIELVEAGKVARGNLSARMASPDLFKGAGIDYPGTLPKLKFRVETRADGEPYLKVTTTQPVNDPFVSVLVELSWSSGRLLREYTFLLDPPGFQPEQPKASEVRPVPSKVGEPVERRATAASVSDVKNEPMSASAPASEKTVAAGNVMSARKSAEGGNVASGVIKVKRGDTLNKIAREQQPKSPDVSLERMLVALYQANTDAFDDNNMNRLQVGKILRVPENTQLDNLTQVEAVKEIRAQAADWHAYRQKLAAASGATTEAQAPRQETFGKISTTVSDKTPPAKESAKEVVRLSKGEAPGDKSVAGGNTKALQDKVHALEEEAIARSKALKDSNDRIAMLEKSIKEMQRLIELRAQPAAPAKPEIKPEPAKAEPVSAAPVAASQPLAAPVIEAASAVASAASAAVPAKPAKKPAAPKVEPPPPSMLDEVLGEPLYLAGGAIALLGLGGLGFVVARRGKASKSGLNKDAAAHISAPVAPSPETGDFTQATVPPVASELSDDVDPISEADLFLNFGRDAQAEEILKDALQKTPDNLQVQLKLLSIYADRKDAKSFSALASQVQTSGNAAEWAQAAEMGRRLEPGNPMFGGDGNTVAVNEADATPTGQAVTELDFDLGFGAGETGVAAGKEAVTVVDVPLEAEAVAAGGIDFDLGLGAPEAAVSADESHDSTATLNMPSGEDSNLASGLDFDLGSDMKIGAATASLSQPEAVEVMPSEKSPEAEVAPGEAAALPQGRQQSAEETLLDFDITALQEPEQADVSTPGMEDLVFDVTSSHPALDAKTEQEPAADTEGTLEFTLDIPPAENFGAASTQIAAGKPETVDLGDISLNLDTSANAPIAEAKVKDMNWHDVATKLDLARAYQEMGDSAGAQEILEEVMREGDEQQRATAEAMIQQMST